MEEIFVRERRRNFCHPYFPFLRFQDKERDFLTLPHLGMGKEIHFGETSLSTVSRNFFNGLGDEI